MIFSVCWLQCRTSFNPRPQWTGLDLNFRPTHSMDRVRRRERDLGMRVQVGTVSYEALFSSERLHFNRREVMCLCEHGTRRIRISGRAGPPQLGKIWSRLIPAIADRYRPVWQHQLSTEIEQTADDTNRLLMFTGDCAGSPDTRQVGHTSMRVMCRRANLFPTPRYPVAASRLLRVLSRFAEDCGGGMTLAEVYHILLHEVVHVTQASGGYYICPSGGSVGGAKSGVATGYPAESGDDGISDRRGVLRQFRRFYHEFSRYQVLYLPAWPVDGILSGVCRDLLPCVGVNGLFSFGCWSGHRLRGHMILTFSRPAFSLSSEEIYLSWLAAQVMAGFAMLPVSGKT